MNVYAEGARWRPLFFCLLFVLAGHAAAASGCAPPADAQATSIRYVIDGDTAVLRDGRHVRLIGLNAPEIGHDGDPDQPFARAARDALKARIARAHDRVLLAPGPVAHDRYGRLLAHLYTASGNDLSAAILRLGLASLIAIPPDITRLDCYRAAEAAARREGKGLWAKPSPLIVDARKVDRDHSGYLIVRGTVSAVHAFHAGVRLELGGRVWLWLPHKDLGAFSTAPSAYKGRKILARGWLHAYHGHPEMVIHDPAVLSAAD